MSVYAIAAQRYRRAGWVGVLPLPSGKKSPPPSGLTGADGRWPTDEDIERWMLDNANGNIGLRVNDTVVGLDVDAYKDDGVRTLAALKAECGPLPKTWRSSSRNDGSGIFFYKVPAGTKLVGAPGPGIEVVQATHRYAVVWPSKHPEGGTYVWRNPQGQVVSLLTGEVPNVDDLPELPAAWLTRLEERSCDSRGSSRATPTDEWAPQVQRILADAVVSLGHEGGRHDATNQNVLALVRLAERQFPGAEDALETLHAQFVVAVRDRSDGPEAEREWLRMVEGAQQLVGGNPSDSTWADLQDERSFDWLPAAMRQDFESTAVAEKVIEELESRHEHEAQQQAAHEHHDSNVHFPVEVFPPALQAMIEETARSTSTHPDMVASLALPVLAAAIGNSRAIEMKADWKERCRIWLINVADPSSRKSPAGRQLLIPTRTLQREWDDEFKELMARFDAAGVKEARPTQRHMVVSNFTIEALQSALKDHPRGTLTYRDELTGWLSAMGQYKHGRGDDRQIWLELWSGEPIRILRKGSEPIILPDPFVCVCGGTQPGKINEFLVSDDGFAQRFLYVVPGKVRANAWSPAITQKTADKYDTIIRRLYALEGDDGEPEVIRYQGTAQEMLYRELQNLYDDEVSGELNETLVTVWGKFEAYIGRLALLLTELWYVAEHKREVITEERIQDAAKILTFYKDQAVRIFADQDVAPPSQDFTRLGARAREDLVKFVKKQGPVTLRELMNRGPAAMRAASTREVLMLARDAELAGKIVVKEGARHNSFVLEAL